MGVPETIQNSMIADDVSEHRADQRRGSQDRQRAKTIDHALRDVRVEGDARVDGAEQRSHDERPGSKNCR